MYDVVIIGSGAGGGTVAQELGALARSGRRVLVVEQGPRFRAEDFTGRELEMASALYEDGGGVLTADGSLTLALGRAYGGSTVVYTGTSLVAPERVIRSWEVPGLSFTDVERRSRKYLAQNNAHLIEPELLNENNRLFVEGCRKLGLTAGQFPVNVKGCMGSSLCNLGCPNLAKMGTHRVQLPAAERMGVEVATRAEALWLEERAVVVRVSERPFGGKGGPPEWEPGEYRIEAPLIVCAAGAVGTSALLLRSEPTRRLQRVGERFTCHPAHILVAEHEHEITNDVGHPKSFYLDRSEEEGYVLETCMYFPATTAKNLTGLGPDHSAMMHAFPRLQMILALGCDKAAHGNRIAIDRDGRAVVHYTCTRATVEALVRATRTAARIFFAAGARRVHAPSADPPLVGRGDVERLDRLIHARHFQRGRTSISAAHPMGGAKMGHPHDSVTDAWGRVHGMPWLRIADASLFPNSVEVNPYVTIMALADRVAEKIRDEAGAMAI